MVNQSRCRNCRIVCYKLDFKPNGNLCYHCFRFQQRVARNAVKLVDSRRPEKGIIEVAIIAKNTKRII